METTHQHYIQQINDLKERLAIELSRNTISTVAHGAHALAIACPNSSTASLLEQTIDQTSDSEAQSRFKKKLPNRQSYGIVKQKALRKPRHVAVDYEMPSGKTTTMLNVNESILIDI